MIRYYGDPVLAKNCFEYKVETDGEPLTALGTVVNEMFDTMKRLKGVGLAANQIGLPYPIFVWKWNDSEGVAVNPVLEEWDDGGVPISHKEGCLSAPGVEVPMKRISKCRLTAYGMDGKEFTIEADGFLSTVFQHEMDHLYGYCIVDHLNREQRRSVKKQFAKAVGK